MILRHLIYSRVQCSRSLRIFKVPISIVLDYLGTFTEFRAQCSKVLNIHAGLPMHKNLEEAFDANAFVIAPAAVPEKNQPVEWKIVLTKKFAKLTIFDNTSYGVP